jgi:hypothetical protein
MGEVLPLSHASGRVLHTIETEGEIYDPEQNF